MQMRNSLKSDSTFGEEEGQIQVILKRQTIKMDYMWKVKLKKLRLIFRFLFACFVFLLWTHEVTANYETFTWRKPVGFG